MTLPARVPVAIPDYMMDTLIVVGEIVIIFCMQAQVFGLVVCNFYLTEQLASLRCTSDYKEQRTWRVLAIT